jgi:hypothetical protein
MGSAHSKPPSEAELDISDDRYIELKKCLTRDGKFALDFNSFVKLITSFYERLVSVHFYLLLRYIFKSARFSKLSLHSQY